MCLQGKTFEAEDMYEKTLKLDPNHEVITTIRKPMVEMVHRIYICIYICIYIYIHVYGTSGIVTECAG